jgi:hypothetical protein
MVVLARVELCCSYECFGVTSFVGTEIVGLSSPPETRSEYVRDKRDDPTSVWLRLADTSEPGSGIIRDAVFARDLGRACDSGARSSGVEPGCARRGVLSGLV